MTGPSCHAKALTESVPADSRHAKASTESNNVGCGPKNKKNCDKSGT